jgi:hypothetical protein
MAKSRAYDEFIRSTKCTLHFSTKEKRKVHNDFLKEQQALHLNDFWEFYAEYVLYSIVFCEFA